MKRQLVIFIGDGPWRAATIAADAVRWIPLPECAGADLPQRAAQIRDAIISSGCAEQPCLLAIPSSGCLSAHISTAKLDRGNRRDALAFRLEEHLPISAEEFIADYHDLGDEAALGVCTDAARLRAVLAALEAAGLPVSHICPQALLAAAHAAVTHSDIQKLLLSSESNSGCDLIEFNDGTIVDWKWFPSDDAKPESASISISPDDSAARQAAKILDGTAWPLIDFRRGGFAQAARFDAYRAPLKAVAAALLFLLAAIALAAQWRTAQYQSIARQRQQKQIEVFKRLFPDQRAPANVASRLQNEQRKIAALQGQAGDDDASRRIAAASALEQLRDLLKGLPPEMQFQIVELNLQPDLIRIEGQALRHVDAERIAAALRQTGAFEVDPPKTDSLKSGDVSFSFIARPRIAAAAAKAGL